MNAKLRNQINQFADAIRDAFDIDVPITNIEAVVEQKIGGKIEQCMVLPRFADGKIQRIGENFKIQIPFYQTETRKRFSIAHELGHLFLHMGYSIDKNIWEKNKDNEYFRIDGGELEYQAHEFAAALLMPKEKFAEIMEHNYMGNGRYNIEKVANYFNVSFEAAVNRGRWLGLLAWG